MPKVKKRHWVYDDTCSKCKISAFCTHVCIPGEGSTSAKIMIIGEAPGRDEDLENRVFIGKSGKYLRKCLKEAGIKKEDVFITNVVKCAPFDEEGNISNPDDVEIASCIDYLWEEIELINPKLIITVGGKSTGALLNKWKISKVRGNLQRMEFECSSGKKKVFKVLPTWHPAYIIRGNQRAGYELMNDLLYAKQLISKKVEEKVKYELVNDQEDLVLFVDKLLKMHENRKLSYGAIAVDVETSDDVSEEGSKPKPYSPSIALVSIQISWAEGEAALIPVIREESVFNDAVGIKILRGQMKRIFDRIPVVGQNFKFDCTVLYTKLGLEVKHVVFDTLLAHHMLFSGSLPNSLEFMAGRYLHWMNHKDELRQHIEKLPKGMGNMMNVPLKALVKYGCADSDSTLRLYPIFKEMLKKEDYSSFGLDGETHYHDMYSAYKALYIYPFKSVLGMELAGVKLDIEKFPELEESLKSDMDAQIDRINSSVFYPRFKEITKIDNPKRRRKRRKKKERFLHCKRCGYEKKWEKGKKAICSKCGATGYMTKDNENIQWIKKDDEGPEFIIDKSQPKYAYKVFKPGSPQQVKTLLFDVMDLPENDEGTTDRNALLNLVQFCVETDMEKELEVIDSILDYRKSAKLYSSYVKSLPGFIYVDGETKSPFVTSKYEPDTGVNHIHTNYSQAGTRSGRLSTRDPGLHMIPSGKSPIKERFISRYSNGLILQCDFSQLEVRILAVVSGDPGLKGVFQRGEDPHRYVASMAYRKPESEITDQERKSSKAVTFGVMYGRGAKAISEEAVRSVADVAYYLTVKEAEALKRNFFKRMPKTKKWINRQHKFVKEHKCCISPLGRVRWMQEEIDSGDEGLISHAERVAVNHPIQSLGADINTQAIARIFNWQKKKDYKSRVFGSVHDSVVIDVEGTEVIEVMKLARREMHDKAHAQFPWFDVPLDIDIELGVVWGRLMKVESFGKGSLVLKGSVRYFNEVFAKLKESWRVTVKSLEWLGGEGDEKNCRVSLDFS